MNSEVCTYLFELISCKSGKCSDLNIYQGAWCALEVNEAGEVIAGKWEDCDLGCPGEGLISE